MSAPNEKVVGNVQCSLCATDCTRTLRDDAPNTYRVQCPACKVYYVDVLFEPQLRALDESTRYRLCAVSRDSYDNGHSIEIDATNCEELSSRARRWTRLTDGVDRLLLELSRHALGRRDPVNFNPAVDFPLISARGRKETDDLILFATELGYLQASPFRIAFKGWQRVEELETTNPNSRQAFVAMWFDESLLDVYKYGFKPAIESSNYFTAVRVDALEYNDGVDDRIIAEIRRSSFLVADFTGNRPSVYFEAGYALGLGLSVIWTCRDDFVDKLHFDVRQKNHVTWAGHDELREKLDRRVRATVLPVGWR